MLPTVTEILAATEHNPALTTWAATNPRKMAEAKARGKALHEYFAQALIDGDLQPRGMSIGLKRQARLLTPLIRKLRDRHLDRAAEVRVQTDQYRGRFDFRVGTGLYELKTRKYGKCQPVIDRAWLQAIAYEHGLRYMGIPVYSLHLVLCSNRLDVRTIAVGDRAYRAYERQWLCRLRAYRQHGEETETL